MKEKKLITLAALAVILVAIAYVTSNDKKSMPSSELGELAFPDLPLNDIESVTITSTNDRVHMVKSEGNWKVETLYNYPVKFERLKEAMLSLSKLKIGQKVSASEKQMKEMQLVSPLADKQNGGILVEMNDGSGKTIAALIIGVAREVKPEGPQSFGPYPEGQFISRDGGKTAYLVSKVMNEFYPRSFDWVEDKLLNIPAADIKEVAMTNAEGKQTKLVKPEDKDELVIEELAANEELNTSNLSSVESVLSYFYAKGVADPALTDEQMGFDKPALFVAKTGKNEIYTVKIGKASESDKNLQYIRVSAEVTASPALPEDGKTDEEKKKQAEEETKHAEEIKELNEHFGKWTYLIDTYKIENMTMDRSKLVKEKETEEKKKEADEQTGTEE